MGPSPVTEGIYEGRVLVLWNAGVVVYQDDPNAINEVLNAKTKILKPNAITEIFEPKAIKEIFESNSMFDTYDHNVVVGAYEPNVLAEAYDPDVTIEAHEQRVTFEAHEQRVMVDTSKTKAMAVTIEPNAVSLRGAELYAKVIVEHINHLPDDSVDFPWFVGTKSAEEVEEGFITNLYNTNAVVRIEMVPVPRVVYLSLWENKVARHFQIDKYRCDYSNDFEKMSKNGYYYLCESSFPKMYFLKLSALVEHYSSPPNTLVFSNLNLQEKKMIGNGTFGEVYLGIWHRYKGPAPKESASKESASKESASKESASKESASKESASKESASKESASKESASKESASKESASKESASKESASKESASKESASKESASKESASKESASKESASKESASKESASKESASKESASKKSASKKSASKESASKESASKESASKESASKESASKESASKESASKESASKESASNGSASNGFAPKGSTHESVDVVIKKATDNGMTLTREDFLDHAKILGTLSHPHLVTFYGMRPEFGYLGRTKGFIRSGKTYGHLVQEFVKGCNLRSFLRKARFRKRTFKQHIMIKIIYQVADGLEYLESRGIFYRNLSLWNVRVTNDVNCKISDFGFEKISILREDEFGNSTSSVQILPRKNDAVAFGILMYDVFTYAVYSERRYERVLMDEPDERFFPAQPASCPLDVYNMIVNCWKIDIYRSKRPYFSSLKTYFNCYYNNLVASL